MSHEPTQLEDEIVLPECTEDTSPPEEVVSTELNGDPLLQEDGIMPTELAQDSSPGELESVYDDYMVEAEIWLYLHRKLPPNKRYNLRQKIKPPKRLIEQATVWDELTS